MITNFMKESLPIFSTQTPTSKSNQTPRGKLLPTGSGYKGSRKHIGVRKVRHAHMTHHMDELTSKKASEGHIKYWSRQYHHSAKEPRAYGQHDKTAREEVVKEADVLDDGDEADWDREATPEVPDEEELPNSLTDDMGMNYFDF